MDLSIIEANKNILIFKSFSVAASSFSQNLYVPFTPDYVIVRGVTYAANNGDVAQTAYLIYTDLVSDHIGSFSINDLSAGGPGFQKESISIQQPLYFKLMKPVSSDFTFTIKNSLTTPANLNGALAIHLEFIKLKSQKPQVIY